jgi:hypothetical protein
MIRNVDTRHCFCPQLFCDHCGIRIRDARWGMFTHRVDGAGPGDSGQLSVLHKMCFDAFRQQRAVRGWEELRHLPQFLERNLGIVRDGDGKCAVAAESPLPTPEFEALCNLDRRLWLLYQEAVAVKDDGNPDGFCGNDIWHLEFKPRLVQLAGDEAGVVETPNVLGIDNDGPPLLHTSDLLAMQREDISRRDPKVDPRLRTKEAYDLAYETILAALPDCRGCSCVCAAR